MNSGEMLVVAPERWDEACFAVPAVRALAASGLGTGVLCPASQREFWQTLGEVAVIDFPVKTKAKLVAKEISGNWQASLTWQPGLAAEACKLAAIPRRLGPDGREFKKLLTHPLIFSVGPLEHRVRHYLAAVEALGVQTNRPEFFAPAEMGIGASTEGVLLSPDSDFGASHEWQLDGWLELAQLLLTGGQRLTVFTGGSGRKLGEALAKNLGVSAEILIAPELAVLAGQRLVIAADGSLPHLAGHAGAMCVTLFGPNDPAWKRPLGKRHATVRRHVECAPCLLAKCPLDQRCQRELDVQRVWQVVQEKLSR
jgi:ADP-heptose:LPS heptosyltransferase